MNKYLTTPIKQRFLSMSVSQNQWEKWSSSWKFFFVLGQGRSGTNFLANLLDQARGAYVFHEPVLEDFYAYLRAFHSPERAQKYMEGFRKKDIYRRMNHIPTGIYGEVNGVLRCHVDAIRTVFPDVTLVHLVRDGRDVVRSVMSRDTFTIKNPYSFIGIHPRKSDPLKWKWSKMGRFARICWYWQEANKHLRTSIGKAVQFERILSDYEYFSSEILNPCGLQVDKKNWSATTKSPRNITPRFVMPKWDKWNQEQQETFMEICGDEMSKCGYDC